MTTSPNPDDPDSEGKTLPPYDDRQKSASVGGSEEATKDGAHTGGATGPVDADTDEIDDPESTERGEHASPADEQPAEGEEAAGPGGTSGTAHEPGTGRAEDKS
jgi:hypothetical protein